MRNRERRHDADDVLIKVVAAVLVLVFGAWAYAEATDTKIVAPATSRVETAPVASILPPPVPAPEPRPSSINGKVLHACVLGRSKSFQTQACAPPWVEVSVQSLDYAGSQASEEPDAELVRRQAEARLAQEQARFAQLTGANVAAGGYAVATDVDSRAAAHYRCEAAKANREQVLRTVGINRTFDLVRRLNEQVYEA